MIVSRSIPAVLAALAVFSLGPSAEAGTLEWTSYPLGYLQFQINNAGAAETAPALQLNGVFDGGSGAQSFQSFCVDINQSISFNTVYTDFSVAPTGSANGFTVSQAALLGKLYTVAGSIDNKVEASAFQLASWEIMADAPTLNLNSGNFSVTPPGADTDKASAVGLASTWLAALPATTQGYTVTKLYSPTAQDLVFGTPVSAVPEPSSWMLFGIGLGGLLMKASRRHPGAAGAPGPRS